MWIFERLLDKKMFTLSGSERVNGGMVACQYLRPYLHGKNIQSSYRFSPVVMMMLMEKKEKEKKKTEKTETVIRKTTAAPCGMARMQLTSPRTQTTSLKK